jgi:hypothetical protein
MQPRARGGGRLDSLEPGQRSRLSEDLATVEIANDTLAQAVIERPSLLLQTLTLGSAGDWKRLQQFGIHRVDENLMPLSPRHSGF